MGLLPTNIHMMVPLVHLIVRNDLGGVHLVPAFWHSAQTPTKDVSKLCQKVWDSRFAGLHMKLLLAL